MTTPITVEAFGEKKTLKEWSEDHRCPDVSKAAIYARIFKYEWEPEMAITTPTRPYGQHYEAFGVKKTLLDWSKHPLCRTDYKRLYYRVRCGWDIEEAISTPGRNKALQPTSLDLLGQQTKSKEQIEDFYQDTLEADPPPVPTPKSLGELTREVLEDD